MSSIIRIKRSSVSGNPTTLGAGELAYSALTDNGSNGGDRLYVGMGTETSGNAANHVVIGGKYFTDMLDHSVGTLTASSAIIVDSNSKINSINVGNITVTGSTNTISSTDTNGNIVITPNGTGKTVISSPYIGDTATTLAEYIYDTIGGAITGTAGQITVTNSDAGNTSTLALASGVATAGTYGSASAIPSVTIDTYGRVTGITTNSFSSSFTLGSTSIALGATTTAIAGMTSIGFAGSTSGNVTVQAAAVAGTNTLTLPATTGTVITTGDSATVTNTMLAGSIANAKLLNSSVTIGSTSVSLGATVTTFAGLASVTSTTFVGALTGNASTATTLATARTINGTSFNGSADITVTAAAGTLTGTALNATVVSSSLTSVGTIATGVWNGTAVAVGYGGTGTNSGSITGTGALTFTAGGSNTNVNLVPNGTGTVDVGSKRITSLAEPTQATDATTKGYVDAVRTGLHVKDAARLGTTAALTVTYANGTAGLGATLTNAGTQAALVLDSVPAVVGDRILVKDQAAGLQNGIYTVTSIGSVSTNWVLTRATDFDQTPAGEIDGGDFVFIQEGTTQSDNAYVVTTNGTVTVGTTSIDFTQFSGAGQIVAGAGLTKSGNTINAVGTASRISIAADAIDIDSAYVGQTSITTLGTVATGTWAATLIAGQYGGTGVNNSGKTITLGGNLTTSGAFATTLTATATTSVTLPTTGTLATLLGAEGLSNKTITASSFSGTTIAGSGLVTFTNTTDATNLTTAGVVMSGGLAVTKAMYIGTNITGAGAATSTLDGFQIDGGTY